MARRTAQRDVKDATALPSAASFEVSKAVNLPSGVVTEKRVVKDGTVLLSAASFEVSKRVQAMEGGRRGNGTRRCVFGWVAWPFSKFAVWQT